jgi:hypothetical protein
MYVGGRWDERLYFEMGCFVFWIEIWIECWMLTPTRIRMMNCRNICICFYVLWGCFVSFLLVKVCVVKNPSIYKNFLFYAFHLLWSMYPINPSSRLGRMRKQTSSSGSGWSVVAEARLRCVYARPTKSIALFAFIVNSWQRQTWSLHTSI